MFVVSHLVAGFSPKDLACLTLFSMGENSRVAVEEIQSLRSMGSKRWNNPIESSSLHPIVILTFMERRVAGYHSIPYLGSEFTIVMGCYGMFFFEG